MQWHQSSIHNENGNAHRSPKPKVNTQRRRVRFPDGDGLILGYLEPFQPSKLKKLTFSLTCMRSIAVAALHAELFSFNTLWLHLCMPIWAILTLLKLPAIIKQWVILTNDIQEARLMFFVVRAVFCRLRLMLHFYLKKTAIGALSLLAKLKWGILLTWNSGVADIPASPHNFGPVVVFHWAPRSGYNSIGPPAILLLK